MDHFVDRALEQHAEWHNAAVPSLPCQSLVFVEDGAARVLRRPFKKKGAWYVRWAGTARLTNPHEVDGLIVFTASWSSPIPSPQQDREAGRG